MSSSTTRMSLTARFDAHIAAQDAINATIAESLVTLSQTLTALSEIVVAQHATPALPSAVVVGEVVAPKAVTRKRKATKALTAAPVEAPAAKAPAAPKVVTPEQIAEKERATAAWRDAKAARQLINQPLAKWLRANGLPSGGVVWDAARKDGQLDLGVLAQIAGVALPATLRPLAEFLTAEQIDQVTATTPRAVVAQLKSGATPSVVAPVTAAPVKRARKPRGVAATAKAVAPVAEPGRIGRLSQLTRDALANAATGGAVDPAQAQRLRELNALQAAGFTQFDADAVLASR